MFDLRADQLLSIVTVSLGLVFLPTYQFNQPAASVPLTWAYPTVPVAPIPVLYQKRVPLPQTASASAVARFPSTQKLHAESDVFVATLSAQAVYVMDVPSASQLLAKDEQLLYYPASTAKLMTALVVLDTYTVDEVVTVPAELKVEGTVLGLKTGEQLTVRSLLSALLIHSANDAAQVLAAHHPQGEAAFIRAMNDKAKALHLTQTRFENASGLDSAQQQTTARDLALLAREVMKVPLLTEVVGQPRVSISDEAETITHLLFSTNQLLGVLPGIKGVKTGTTDLAGEVLVTQYERDGREILIVIMGSQNRYGDTQAIINWIFNHYQWTTAPSGTLK